MTNDELNRAVYRYNTACVSSFALRHSLDIRHSSFVISIVIHFLVSILKRGWPNSTGWPFSTSTAATWPAISA
jgi:hypothetical protein